MNAFEYARPATAAEAVALLSAVEGETAPLAGGTDLLSLMKDFIVEPKRVVSLMGIAGLATIAPQGAGLSIGATATLDQLLASDAVKRGWPAVWAAAAGVRSPQLRAMGTVGGELLQRPRCWYFRRGRGLLALDEKGASLVAQGDSRYHAIFDNAGPAKFVHASSLAPALIACGASAELLSPRGARSVALEQLFRTPAKPGERETTLAHDELLTGITLPQPCPRSATYEVRPRQGLDWPLVAASVAFGEGASGGRVVLGHVAPRPWTLGEPLSAAATGDDGARAFALAATKGATPLAGNAYKVELAQVAIRRAIRAANQET